MSTSPNNSGFDRIQKVLNIVRPVPPPPLQDRLRDFQRERREMLDKIQSLNAERERIEKAYQNVVQFRRQMDTLPVAPPFEMNDEDLVRDWKERAVRPVYAFQRSRMPGRPQQSYQEIVSGVKQNFYRETKNYEKLRQEVLNKKDYLTKPYRGEASLQQCEPHEMESYLFVRSVLEEEVDKILDRMFAGPYNIQKFREDEHRSEFIDLRREATRMSQMQLIAEQLVLEVTGELSRVIANETIYIFKLVFEVSEDLVCEALLYDGVRANDREYKCKRLFDDLRSDRDVGKVNIWRHDQPLVQPPEATEPASRNSRKKAPAPAKLVHADDVTTIRYDFVAAHLKDLDFLPFDHIPVRAYKYRLREYRQAEVNYWDQFAVTSGEYTLPGEAGSPSSVLYSPNATMLAVGTTNGDVLLFYPWTTPLRPIRGAGSRANGNPVKSLAWSTDSSLLISFHNNYLALWSTVRHYFGENRPNQVDSNDVRSSIRNSLDRNLIAPQQLRSVLLLSATSGDFRFVQSEYGSSGSDVYAKASESWVPTRGCFTPTFDVLGGQHRFCMAMNTNDVLWLSTGGVMQRAIESSREKAGYPPSGDAKFAAANDPKAFTISTTHRVPCEFLRKHNQEVVLTTFADGVNELITLDREGYLYLWDLGQDATDTLYGGQRRNDSKESRISASVFAPVHLARVSQASWRSPTRQYQVAMTKTAFYTIPNSPRIVKFEDTEYLNAARRRIIANSTIRLPSRPLVEAARDRALLEFCRMNFTGSYSSETTSNVRTRLFYDPSDSSITQQQAYLHILLDDVAPAQTELLRKTQPVRKDPNGKVIESAVYGIGPLVIAYYTQLYRAASIEGKLVACCVNPTRTTLVVVVVYMASEFKAAHLNIVAINLQTMKAFEPLIEHFITNGEATRIRDSVANGLAASPVHVAVTRVVSTLATDYVLLEVLGTFFVYSLLGGRAVMRSASIGSPISTIADIHFGIMRTSTFFVASEASERFNRLQFLCNRTGVRGVRYINLEDRNAPADRAAMSGAAQRLRLSTASSGCPTTPLLSDVAFNPLKCKLGYNFDHKIAEMRRIAYEIMDRAVQTVSGAYPTLMLSSYEQQIKRDSYRYADRLAAAASKREAAAAAGRPAAIPEEEEDDES